MQPKLKYPFKHSISIAFFTAILFVPVIAFSQSPKAGSIEYLKSCNGFNGIKLGSDINEIPARELTYMDGNSRPDADSCISYVYQDENVLKVDSDFALQQVGIRAYKNKIVNIYLFFSVKDSYKILRDFLTDYGQFNELPKEYAAIYDWNTKAVKLSLEYQAKVETGVAIFTCNKLVGEIDAMKERQKAIDNFIESLTSIAANTKYIITAR